MKKIISLICSLVIIVSALFLTSCKKDKVYYFDTSSVLAEDVISDHGVVVDKTNFPEDVEIKVTKVKERDRRFLIARAVLPEATKLFVYDISSIRNGVTIKPYSSANIIFPVPSIYSEEKYEMYIYSIAANAATEYVEYKQNDNGLYINVNETGLFAIMLIEIEQEDTSSTISGTQSEANTSSKNNTSSGSSSGTVSGEDGSGQNVSSNPSVSSRPQNNTSSKRPQPSVITPDDTSSNTSSNEGTTSNDGGSSSQGSTTSNGTTTSKPTSSNGTTTSKPTSSNGTTTSKPSTSTSKPNSTTTTSKPNSSSENQTTSSNPPVSSNTTTTSRPNDGFTSDYIIDLD